MIVDEFKLIENVIIEMQIYRFVDFSDFYDFRMGKLLKMDYGNSEKRMRPSKGAFH